MKNSSLPTSPPSIPVKSKPPTYYKVLTKSKTRKPVGLMQSCFLSFSCTPRPRVHAHHALVCMHTMPSCAHTPRHHVHAHHVVCVHMTLCTPCSGVHFSQISLQSHVTTHLSQSEGSILANLSDLVRNCEISPKIFPPFKEQSCCNSSAKNTPDIGTQSKDACFYSETCLQENNEIPQEIWTSVWYSQYCSEI